MKKVLLSFIFLMLLSACGAGMDMAQQSLVSEDTIDNPEQKDKDDVTNPSESSDIDDTQDNIENNKPSKPTKPTEPPKPVEPPEPPHKKFPLVQRQTIVLQDGREITINNPKNILDTAILQIRKTGELIYKGLKPSYGQTTQAGILKDSKNHSVFPVIIINHGHETNNIPKGGHWEGSYYGEFQGKENAYDILGNAQANLDLTNDKIDGQINNLYSKPADTNLSRHRLNGQMEFSGQIQDGQWSGTALSHDLMNPETGQAFLSTNGTTNGAFISKEHENIASDAAGQVTLTDKDGQGFTGSFVMQHRP
ncbi:MAG: hypothetical protein ACK5MJ_03715 [Alphaproteobacteria bacterium]